MADSYRITCDLFAVPTNGPERILYAPRHGFACLANTDLVNLLADLDKLDLGQLNAEQQAALDYLEKRGLLNGEPGLSVSPPRSETYAPTQVTLFPTNQCNLRCTYCYASAGDRAPQSLCWFHATSAIDRVVENVLARGQRRLSLGFHGGGEPLFDWPLVKRIVGYAQSRSAQEGLELGVYSATNGVLSLRQLEWIVQHFSNLNISFDGLPEVQDAQRPLPEGHGSFRFVDRTLRYLDEHGFPYGIRSTISRLNVDRMETCLDFIAENYRAKTIHFEPLFSCGRCKTSGQLSPPMRSFAEGFKRCLEHADEKGIKLTYSGSRIENLTRSFCGVSNDNFSVTPGGYISTCYEVTSKDDPRAETFFIGYIDEAGQLVVDEKKRRALHRLSVDHLPFCKHCYAKWHCAGDCLTKLGHANYSGRRGHERCNLNRELVALRLRRLFPSANAGDQAPSTTNVHTALNRTVR